MEPAIALALSMFACSEGGQEHVAAWFDSLCASSGTERAGVVLDRARRFVERRTDEIHHVISSSGCVWFWECDESTEALTTPGDQAYETGDCLGHQLVMLELSLEIDRSDWAAHHLGHALLCNDVATLRWLDERWDTCDPLLLQTDRYWESCPVAGGAVCGSSYDFFYDPCIFVQLACRSRLGDDAAVKAAARPYLLDWPLSLHAGSIVRRYVTHRISHGERDVLLVELAELLSGESPSAGVDVALAYVYAHVLWDQGQIEDLTTWASSKRQVPDELTPDELLKFLAELAGS